MPHDKAIILCAVSTVVQANEDEKFSMPHQEADARAFASRMNMTVIDVLRVPGHSRDYLTLEELAVAAQKEGIDAFHRLIDHLDACDFDVLICRDANRFARTASLLHYIVARIMQCGARIYSLTDGWVDRTNANIWAAFKGYETNQQMSWLRDSKAKGYEKRVERGLLVSSKVPPFLRVVRDPETGKEQYVEINEELRRLYDDMAAAILAGIPWYEMELTLFEQGGHVNPKTGKRWAVGRLRDFVFNPLWWGHSAMNHQYKDGKRTKSDTAWVWDETITPPEGFIVARNTLEPIWTGQLAKDIQQELTRRAQIGKKGHSSMPKGRFGGLLVCQDCGYSMTLLVKKQHADRGHGWYSGWRCITRYTQHQIRRNVECKSRGMISDKTIQAYIHKLILTYAANEGTNPLLGAASSGADKTRAIELAEEELIKATEEVKTLIRQEARASEAAQGFYREEIDTVSERVKNLKQHIQTLRRDIAQEQRIAAQRHEAIRTVAEHIDEFWSWPALRINQKLHDIFGNARIVILNREIVGIAEKTATGFIFE